MKLLIRYSFLLLIMAVGASAQTRPQQSMYMFNVMLINPAGTGLEDYGQLRAGVRQQWRGVSGAPATFWASADMRAGKDNRNTDGAAISKGHGIGASIFYDKIGPYATANVNLAYAYHLPLSSSLALSAGFSGGLQQTRYDRSSGIYPDQAGDPATMSQAAASRKYLPDLNAGLLLNGNRFFAGLALTQLAGAEFVNAPKAESSLKQQFIGSLGYRFPFGESGSGLWLSGMAKSDFTAPVRYDFNAKARYQDLLWLAANYRLNDAIGAGFGCNPTQRIVFGYQYEWGIGNQVSIYSKGSHEVFIGLKFLKDGQSSRPKMGW
ncbi:PorP/SprF family type IX secretion system membrane protein [Chitinophaga sp. sic0106]|uniref:PorP/SprF family type IX secretion system membrane protein n=1 Tax=Chitinophaga sp. sic0106 TaxID=2854785 RepID=UPI001C45BE28|nr:PorP/SprF family type IX secretion system membrane protein [Chitinophaga sp. sic0106]MBV7529899.1 PorP/SprF family type IX secretion system membrane protein [Chitinophaga sp. sic0106]